MNNVINWPELYTCTNISGIVLLAFAMIPAPRKHHKSLQRATSFIIQNHLPINNLPHQENIYSYSYRSDRTRDFILKSEVADNLGVTNQTLPAYIIYRILSILIDPNSSNFVRRNPNLFSVIIIIRSWWL